MQSGIKTQGKAKKEAGVGRSKDLSTLDKSGCKTRITNVGQKDGEELQAGAHRLG
jgi:hypothetical protein